MATTYELIASTTVGSGGASSITFMSTGNIPNTYTDLKLVYSIRGSSATVNTKITINSSTSSFSYRQLYGDGSAAASNNGANNYAAPLLNQSTTTSNTFASCEIYIPNYLSSNNKSYSIESTTENNASSAYMALLAGLWSNTNAITSISIAPDDATNFAQYSTAYLYGIKNS